MTEKEIIELENTRNQELARLDIEMGMIKTNFNLALLKYQEEHSKFKIGDAVIYLKEKYKKPRKYYVSSIWTDIIDVWDDENKKSTKKGVVIYYKVATANGHFANGGWYIMENDLKKY